MKNENYLENITRGFLQLYIKNPYKSLLDDYKKVFYLYNDVKNIEKEVEATEELGLN